MLHTRRLWAGGAGPCTCERLCERLSDTSANTWRHDERTLQAATAVGTASETRGNIGRKNWVPGLSSNFVSLINYLTAGLAKTDAGASARAPTIFFLFGLKLSLVSVKLSLSLFRLSTVKPASKAHLQPLYY